MKNYLLLFSVLGLLLTYNTAAQAPNWQWANRAGGAENEYAQDIAADNSGNSYITGAFFSSTITFGSFQLTNAGSTFSSDMFIVKYNSSGNVLWAQRAGGGSSESGHCAATDVFGNCYVVGMFFGSSITFGTTTLTNIGGDDIFIVKYDPSGNVLWARSCGGSGGDQPYSIGVDGAGACYIAGCTTSFSLVFGSINLVNNVMYSVPFIAKYDASGNAAWAKIGGGSNNSAAAYGAASDPSGNNYITGYFYGTQIVFGADTLFNPDNTGNNAAVFFVKYDVLGNQVWAKCPATSGYSIGYAVAGDAAGNSYLTGYFGGSTIIFDADTLHNHGYNNIFLTKYDLAGNVVWTKREGGWFDDSGTEVKVDGSGNVYLAGYFRSDIVNFDLITLTNAGASSFSPDLFVAKYNSSGNLLWVKNAGGSLTDALNGLAIDGLGNSYVAGFFYSPTLAFGTTSLANTDSTTYDVFIAKLDNTGTTVAGINSNTVSDNFSFFPNPSSGRFHLNINTSDFSDLKVEVYDAMGNVILKSGITDSNPEIDLSGNAAGIYFYRIYDSAGILSNGKIMLE